MKVIFVCTGNTCRSPMAEKIFANMTKNKGVEVASRGVMCDEHFPMNLNAKIVMREKGLATDHESKSLTKEDIESADYVITMTQSHKMYIESLFGKCEKLHTLSEYTNKGDVIDPYGGDIFEYRRCAMRLEEDLGILKDAIIPKEKKSKKTEKKDK